MAKEESLNDRLDKFEKESNEYLKNLYKKEVDSKPYNSKQIKEQFEKKLKEIEIKHKDFFDKCPSNINGIESFVIPNNYFKSSTIGFNNIHLISDDLKSDILSAWTSINEPSTLK